MKTIIILLLVTLSSTFAYTQYEYKKNHIQIGRSGYSFGDQPFRIGRIGLGVINHGIGIAPYLPYVSYERRFSSQFSVRLSIEEFMTSYYCKKNECDSPPLNKVFVRGFYDIQVDAKRLLINFNRLRFNGVINSSFIVSGSQSRTIAYIDHGFWRESFVEAESINGIGLGLGTDISYNIFKGITINLKTGYLYYFSPLKNSLYMGLSMGYEF